MPMYTVLLLLHYRSGQTILPESNHASPDVQYTTSAQLVTVYTIKQTGLTRADHNNALVQI